MENTSVNKGIGALKTRTDAVEPEIIDLSKRAIRSDSAVADLISEGGEDFWHYLQFLNLGKATNLIVLSPRHHYYFEHHDLADVKVLVNIVRLNQIKNLDNFLATVHNVLPPRAYFIGCFTDSRMKNSNHAVFRQPLRIFNTVFNFLNSKTERIMSKKDVNKLFSSFGYRMDDMTEINGLMYFNAQVRKEVKADH